jgi:murein hydrolase activator
MRHTIALLGLGLLPVMLAAGLSAQSVDDQQQALRQAKARAAAAEERSDTLRQEASNADRAVDRIVAQRAALSADIDAANAQIDAAKARIAIIARRQRAQQAQLGQRSEPVLRLNAALQQMTGRPTALMMAQPGQRSDYIHLRAIMATVQPEIARRTAALRQQIAIQKDLRGQELLALKSLGDARGRLQSQRSALAKLEGSSRGRADSLSADAAVEFEQAIAQGERARDIVEDIDSQRSGGETAADLATLDGPVIRAMDTARPASPARGAYRIPEGGQLLFGFSELNNTGYRERGIKLRLPAASNITAPASGRVSFAGPYRSYGQIVIIEHGGGWSSLITNIGSLSVAKGAQVSQGAVLGSVTPDNPDITIELRRHGRTMDIAALQF